MRNRKCKRCGTHFVTEKSSSVYCDDCRTAIKKESVLLPRTCVDCGTSFPGGPRAKRCPSCRSEITRLRDREYKKNGPARKKGSLDTCASCGAAYAVDGGLQRYCKSCAAEATRQNVLARKSATTPPPENGNNS